MYNIIHKIEMNYLSIIDIYELAVSIFLDSARFGL